MISKILQWISHGHTLSSDKKTDNKLSRADSTAKQVATNNLSKSKTELPQKSLRERITHAVTSSAIYQKITALMHKSPKESPDVTFKLAPGSIDFVSIRKDCNKLTESQVASLAQQLYDATPEDLINKFGIGQPPLVMMENPFPSELSKLTDAQINALSDKKQAAFLLYIRDMADTSKPLARIPKGLEPDIREKIAVVDEKIIGKLHDNIKLFFDGPSNNPAASSLKGIHLTIKYRQIMPWKKLKALYERDAKTTNEKYNQPGFIHLRRPMALTEAMEHIAPERRAMINFLREINNTSYKFDTERNPLPVPIPAVPKEFVGTKIGNQMEKMRILAMQEDPERPKG